MLKQIFKSANRLNKNKSTGFTLLNSTRSERSNLTGFTLIELLVVISIIGFITVSSVVVFNIVRKNSRDAVRVGNITTIKRALAMYLNDSGGYPASVGECLSAGAGVGAILKTSKVLLTVPLDPLPQLQSAAPNPSVAGDTDGFCYWYVSSSQKLFDLSYFLESTSNSGAAGSHTINQFQ
ncbi:MAG: type II secretion system protein [Patescibacteria group bacterium]